MTQKRLIIFSVALAIGAAAWAFRARLFREPRQSRALIAGLSLAQVDADPALERIVLWRSDRHAADPQSVIEAVDQSGESIWSRSVPPAQSGAPIRTCGDTLLIGVSAAPTERDPPLEVVALDARSGQERWRWRTTDGLYDQLGELAFVGCDHDRVFVHARGAPRNPWSWHALDRASGAERWSIPGLSSPSTPVALGNAQVAILRSDTRLGVVVDPETGAASDIPIQAWPEGGGRVRDVQRDGDQLTGVAFSDGHDGCVLVGWRAGDTVWRPITASPDLDCLSGTNRGLFRLTPDHALAPVADGSRVVALSRKTGGRVFEALIPKRPPQGSHVTLARAPSDRLDDVIATRYAPLLLSTDDLPTRYQIVVIDTEAGRLHWASDWFSAPTIDHGWRVRHGQVTWFQIQTGAEQASWLGIDGTTGRAVGAWGYHFEGTGDTPPQHAEIPRLPSPEEWDGDTLHTYYWVAAVAVDVTSSAAGWRQSMYGDGKGVVVDRREAVVLRVGPLP